LAREHRYAMRASINSVVHAQLLQDATLMNKRLLGCLGIAATLTHFIVKKHDLGERSTFAQLKGTEH
jgi:hypothetical protein